MAYIEPRKNKKGEITSYRIIVSDGMDLDGKQIRRIMTWTPTPGMSQHQIEKELNAAAVKFEEQIEYGYQLDSQQTLAEYIEYVLDLKERAGIAPRTLDRYRSLRTRILKALGHMKLSQIRPQHLNSFYKDLAQPGVRDYPTAVSLQGLVFSDGISQRLHSQPGDPAGADHARHRTEDCKRSASELEAPVLSRQGLRAVV